MQILWPENLKESAMSSSFLSLTNCLEVLSKRTLQETKCQHLNMPEGCWIGVGEHLPLIKSVSSTQLPGDKVGRIKKATVA